MVFTFYFTIQQKLKKYNLGNIKQKNKNFLGDLVNNNEVLTEEIFACELICFSACRLGLVRSSFRS